MDHCSAVRSEPVRSVNFTRDMGRRDENSSNLGTLVHLGFAEVLFQPSIHRDSEPCNFRSKFEAILIWNKDNIL